MPKSASTFSESDPHPHQNSPKLSLQARKGNPLAQKSRDKKYCLQVLQFENHRNRAVWYPDDHPQISGFFLNINLQTEQPSDIADK